MAVKGVHKQVKVKVKVGKGSAKQDAEPKPNNPLVPPCPDEPKSGCLYCPLFPFQKDFSEYAVMYKRDWQKIVEKERDPHTIRTRNVREYPLSPVKVLFVGEAPGAVEDGQGIPFRGKSGKILRSSVETTAELAPGDYACSNVLGCRPPRNRDPRKTEVRCCAHELAREIELRDPKLIVVLGNHSLELLTGQTGITTLAGHFLKGTHPAWKNKDVLACLHPAYVLRFDFMLEKFLDTISLAGDYVRGDYTPLPGYGEYHVLTTLDAVRELVEVLLASEKITFDTETGSLTPFQQKFPPLLCFSFSHEPQVGYTVPFDHTDSPWCVGGEKEHEREDLIAILRDLFESNVPKVAQNEKFDRQHIRKALGGCEIRALLRDTMLTHLVIDERRGTHGLKRLAFVYTGMGGYERPLERYIANHPEANPDKGGSYANIPGKVLFPYAGMDADVTLRCDDGMLAEKEYTSNERLRTMANTFLPRLSETLADLEYAGAKIDRKKVAELDVEYTGKMAEQITCIRALPEVKQYEVTRATAKKKGGAFEFNPGSTAQLRTVLFDKYGLEPLEATDAGFSRLVSRYTRINQQLVAKGEPTVDYHSVVRKAIEKREWDLFTTNAETLREYERKGNVLAPLILKYRELEVIHSTFIEPLTARLDSNDCVHGSYLPHGTVTGRLASRDPNLQNTPLEAKCVYISRFGDEGGLLQADYSQIELRLAAAWFNDPKMIKAYKKGIDLHTLTAADMHHMSLQQFLALPEKERKPMRTRAKRINFGCLYGGGPNALVSTLKKDGVYITYDEAKGFIERYYAVRPALKAGIEKTRKSALANGFIDAFTGRRRRVPEVFSDDKEIRERALRQIVNFPIQCGASEMTLMALILINYVLRKDGYQSKAILTVHDSIVFDCLLSELLAVAKIAKEIMENLPLLSDEVFPGIDWTWMTVPIVAEMETGFDWGHLVEFDPFAIDDEAQEEPLFGEDEKGQQILARAPLTPDELWEAMTWKANA